MTIRVGRIVPVVYAEPSERGRAFAQYSTTGAELTSLVPHELATLAPEGVTFRFRLLEEAEVGA